MTVHFWNFPLRIFILPGKQHNADKGKLPGVGTEKCRPGWGLMLQDGKKQKTTTTKTEET